MTLILLFCVFLQSYAAQQRSQEDLKHYLPEEDLTVLFAFKTTNTYTLAKLCEYAEFSHTLLKNGYNIPDGELGLEMDPTKRGFSFSAGLICQALHIMNRHYQSACKQWKPKNRSDENDQERCSDSFLAIISSAKLYLQAHDKLATLKYTQWYSTFYDDRLGAQLKKWAVMQNDMPSRESFRF
ncbi:MAG: hypothetical protein OXC30_01320 [Alphaproteobacteria bacterium]|nr:hypothetical protein [Alphaproteobacteria bacterium]